jgi:DNA-binding transcriptional MocR family regulator
MFSMQDKYRHCMRLSYGMIWNDTLEAALKKLGSMVKDML